MKIKQKIKKYIARKCVNYLISNYFNCSSETGKFLSNCINNLIEEKERVKLISIDLDIERKDIFSQGRNRQHLPQSDTNLTFKVLIQPK